MSSAYLDWAATAPPEPEALETLRVVSLQKFGNPSSRHAAGKEAAALLARARHDFAALVGSPPESVYFTSGGTESNNMVLLSLLTREAKGSLVVSGIEHASVYEPATLLKRLGFEVRFVAADSHGIVRPESIAAALDAKTRMVSVMLVNNETGAVQPIAEIARALRDFERRSGTRIHLHSDCVQALGKIPIDCSELGVDSASFSAHKLGAPRGVGALVLRSPLSPLYRGGGQERGIRPGTENLGAICSMVSTAQRHVTQLEAHRQRATRQKLLLLEGLGKIDGTRLVPEDSLQETQSYSPYITCVAFPPLPGEVLVRTLSDRGFLVSTGSACSSHAKEHSRVLRGMGVDEAVASSAIRISIGYTTTDEEIEAFLEVLDRELATWGLPLRR